MSHFDIADDFSIYTFIWLMPERFPRSQPITMLRPITTALTMPRAPHALLNSLPGSHFCRHAPPEPFVGHAGAGGCAAHTGSSIGVGAYHISAIQFIARSAPGQPDAPIRTARCSPPRRFIRARYRAY